MFSSFVVVALLGAGTDPEPPAPLAQSARLATVRVCNPVKESVGSGVVIDRNGPVMYVLTAAHVVDKADRVEVYAYDPGATARPRLFRDVTVVGRTGSDVSDLALLRVTVDRDCACLPVAARKRKAPLRTPGPAFSVGFSDGTIPAIKAETVACALTVRKGGAADSARFWKCQAAPVLGRSGGPLLDGDGALLGVCSGGSSDVTFYTHLDEIARFLRRNGLGMLAE
jgi:S1-C subfamily serine protease